MARRYNSLRLQLIMIVVALLTFGSLVAAYELLF